MTEQSIFIAALEREPADRSSFLDEACAGEPELRQRVDRLLAVHEQAATFMDRPAAQLEATVTQPPGLEQPGILIGGRYKLLEQIGEGGMGAVWVAKQTEPVKRKVAVKLIKAGMDSQAVVQRFEQERQALALMDHPHIAKVLDAGITDEGRPFFVMELVNGLSLTKFCDETRLGIRERLELFVPICQAVQHAHQKGIVHRDLKPSNILVTLIDGRPIPKVIDFGIAKATGGKLTDQTLSTQFGAAVGTLEYMSPEQTGFSGSDVDTRADVYSLGVILYELLTGLKPFDGRRMRQAAIDELIRIIQEEEPSKPSTRISTAEALPSLAAVRQIEPARLAKLLRGELDWIVMKCLEKQRDRRYETANALARDVQRYLADEVVEARPPSAGYRLKKLVRRNRASVVGASLILLALTVVTLLASVVWIRTERDAAEVARRSAENAKDQESKVRILAQVARQKAMQAERSAVEASQLAEQARQHEEYQAYIAMIGMAAAKIDQNAFGNALAILEACPDRFRNWEWGRLKYLCSLFDRRFAFEAPVEAVAFSPDGTQFVTGGWNRTAKICDWASATELVSLPVGGSYVHAVAFSPSGKFVATGGDDTDRFVRLWDAATGKPVPTEGEFIGHSDAVLSVAFSRDGSRLLTASCDNTARLFDVATGKELRTFRGHKWWVWSAVFSPDGSLIVTASQDGSAIVWDLNTSVSLPPRQFLEHSGPVYAAAFSPDGQFVATGGHDTRILIWRPTDVRPFDLSKLAGDNPTQHVPCRVLQGHLGPVRSLSFSAAGFADDPGLLLSGSQDHTLRVWDAGSGRTLKTMRGHGGWVRACAFSPDGQSLISASHDHSVMLWNLAGDGEFRSLAGHTDAVLSAAFSRDGRRVVTAGRDRTARTWDVATWGALRQFSEGHAFQTSSAIFFADGRKLLTASIDNTVRMWDASTGTELARFDRTGRSGLMALSSNGKHLLTGGERGDAQVWDIDTRKLIKVLQGSQSEVTAVAASPDGKWLFTADSAGRCVLWDAHSGNKVFSLGRDDGYHSGKIVAAAFVPDSSQVLTASHDKTVGCIDVASGKEVDRLVLKHPDSVLALALVPHKRQAFTSCADGLVRLWDLDDATAVAVFRLSAHGAVDAIAVSSDGRQAVFSNSSDRLVHLWDIATLSEVRTPEAKNQSGPFLDLRRTPFQLASVALSPDGRSVLTVGGSEARMWDIPRAEESQSFSAVGIVSAAAFSPDGSRVVTGGWDNTARIWEAETGRALKKLSGHTGYVSSACYSPDGRLILTASDDKTAALWEAAGGKRVRQFVGHTDRVGSAVFSADGKRILTASSDKTARLWDTATGQELRQFKGHHWSVLAAVFSADGSKVLTGSEDNSAGIWDVESGQKLLSLEGHSAPVASVAFFPDGLRVLTGSQDNTAKLWDPLTGKEVLTLKGHSQEITAVDVAPDGRSVLTASRDGTAVIWPAANWRPQLGIRQFTRPPVTEVSRADGQTARESGRFDRPGAAGKSSREVERVAGGPAADSDEQRQVILERLDNDGIPHSSVRFSDSILDELPEVFQILRNGRIRIYAVEPAESKLHLLLDIQLRGGRPIDSREDGRRSSSATGPFSGGPGEQTSQVGAITAEMLVRARVSTQTREMDGHALFSHGRSESTDRSILQREVATRLRELQLERRTALLNCLDAIRRIEDPSPQLAFQEHDAQVALQSAELDLCETPGDRIAIRRTIADAHLERWRLIAALHEAGRRGGELHAELTARASYFAAEIDLVRECISAGLPIPGPAAGLLPHDEEADKLIAATERRLQRGTGPGPELIRLLIQRRLALERRVLVLESIQADAAFDRLALLRDAVLQSLRSEVDVIDTLGLRSQRSSDNRLELESCDRSTARVDVFAAAVNICLEQWRQIAALQAAGRRGGEAWREASNRADYFNSQIELVRGCILAKIPLPVPTGAGPRPRDFDVGVLAPNVFERTDRLGAELVPLLISTCLARGEQLIALLAVREYHSHFDIVDATQQLLDAELDLCDTAGLKIDRQTKTVEKCERSQDRIAIRRQMVENSEQSEKVVQRWHDAGRRGGEEQNYQQAVAARILAQINLLVARAE